jgi:5-methylcytosine-specific restriction enzyme subunit McrC
VVIDTKFTSILATGHFRDASLKSGYLYQIYAYLRSQEGRDPRWDDAAGLFLHPAIDASLYERVVIQNHPITFATVDLSCSPIVIRKELRSLLLEHAAASEPDRLQPGAETLAVPVTPGSRLTFVT